MIFLPARKPVKLLICSRHSGFNTFKRVIQEHSLRHRGQPTIFLFPELAVEGIHLRPRVKEHLREVHKHLSGHGNAFAFLSVHEAMPGSKKIRGMQNERRERFYSISNTGYIALPAVRNGSAPWIVHSKKISTLLDTEAIARSNIPANLLSKQLAEERADKRSARQSFKFPSITIDGREFSHIVCGDIASYSAGKGNKAAVSLVSGNSVDFPLQIHRQEIRPPENGLIVFNDAFNGFKIIWNKEGKEVETDWIKNPREAKAFFKELKKKAGIEIEFI